MDNNTLPAVIKFATNETLVKQVANFFNVSVANVTNQSEVAQENLFDLYEAYRTREKEQLVMYKTVAYVVGTLIILSNLTVVISSGLILRRGQQPKSTYLLLGNVSLADTIIGFSIIFGALIDNSMNSNPLCIFQIGMIVCPAMVSIFSVGLIAVDRYFYILHGLYYQRYFNTTRVRIGILIIWMIGLTLGFMPVTGWVNTELIFSRCYYTALFPASLIFFNTCLSIIPIILVTVLYSIVLVRALRNVRDIKTAQKSVHVNSNSDETPKLRMYRGNTNMSRNSGAVLTKVDKTKIRRCASFHALGNNFDKGNFTNKSEKSKSINDLCKDKAKSTDDVNDSTNGKEVYTNLHDESKFSVYTIESSYSGSKKETPNKFIMNIFHKTKVPAKPKEPNKWRAITVLYQISGPAQEIAALEAHIDIISAKPTRSEIAQLQALVRLSPEEKLQWLQYFDEKQMSYTKVADNLAELLRKEDVQIQATRASASAKRSGRTIGWETYYRHQEINDHLDELAAQYPNLVTVINAALSYEGRQIKYVRISTTRFEDMRKPVIVIDAAIHAREWVTPPVALYIIHQLVVKIVDEALTDSLDWVIIPVANPDGYEYSFDEDRLWRKTRSKSHEGADECPGVDGNRNFDHYWGTVANSANPCTIVYEGPTPFSEPETRLPFPQMAWLSI
ncbi:hypothetical protein MSG28_006834 [Choristoneura fumiferana]|uniref:Uncharacterized protein n=1 Tax=Choristoneura fumiferana TaxID=7141 RepID=A0ACC0JLF5_CHOFU|nr:hypothetical protein MSG28_006834 [Choristoneura fumiferana]